MIIWHRDTIPSWPLIFVIALSRWARSSNQEHLNLLCTDRNIIKPHSKSVVNAPMSQKKEENKSKITEGRSIHCRVEWGGRNDGLCQYFEIDLERIKYHWRTLSLAVSLIFVRKTNKQFGNGRVGFSLDTIKSKCISYCVSKFWQLAVDATNVVCPPFCFWEVCAPVLQSLLRQVFYCN